MDFSIDLILQFIIVFILPISLPILFLILANKSKYSDKTKKIIMLVLITIYNFIIGILGFSIIFCIACIPSMLGINSEVLFIILFIALLIIVFSSLIIPVNLFVKNKTKINLRIFIIIILVIGLGIICSNIFHQDIVNPILDWRKFIDLR